MANIAGDEMSTRTAYFFWIADCSSSMKGAKIESLNYAIRNVIPQIRVLARSHPDRKIKVQTVKFSNGAQWHGPQPISIEDFTWTDLTADGVTDMGHALLLIAEQLKDIQGERGIPPALVLVSDGQPTDNFRGALKILLDQLWGKKSIRLSIGIGEDADYEMLQEFCSDPEVPPFRAENAEDLVNHIRLASTLATHVQHNEFGLFSAPTILSSPEDGWPSREPKARESQDNRW